MKIEEQKITVREVVEGYLNDSEEGVVGYNEQLDIRPKYQREFVYKDKQRDEVIRTVMKGLPLNVMYWVDRGEQYEDDPDAPRYEVMDGQQRTISLCEYVDGSFSVDDKYFYNLPSDQQKRILDYELFVYVCEGTDSEKLEWFRIINIAGEQLTDQELRNAVYAGTWVSDAKRYFSKTGCPAGNIGEDYLKGSSIRQEYLETAISWIADAEGVSIEEYMAKHQNDTSAMRRIESKRKERERGRKLQENIDAGTYVMTAMYGVISRSEYMGKFQEYLMNKYHLKNYAAFQGWISQNAELMGNEYDDFQMRTGLRRMDMDE